MPRRAGHRSCVIRIGVRRERSERHGLACSHSERASVVRGEYTTSVTDCGDRIVTDVGLAGVVGQSVVQSLVARIGVLAAGGGQLERGSGNGGAAVGRQEVVGHAVAVEVLTRAHVERERVAAVRDAIAVVVIVGVVADAVAVGVIPLGVVEDEGVDYVVVPVTVIVAVQHQGARAAGGHGVGLAVGV